MLNNMKIRDLNIFDRRLPLGAKIVCSRDQLLSTDSYQADSIGLFLPFTTKYKLSSRGDEYLRSKLVSCLFPLLLFAASRSPLTIKESHGIAS